MEKIIFLYLVCSLLIGIWAIYDWDEIFTEASKYPAPIAASAIVIGVFFFAVSWPIIVGVVICETYKQLNEDEEHEE